MTAKKTKVAIIGSGNIGTDLMIKVLRGSTALEMGAMVGIDPNSDGLRRAARMKVPTTHEGVEGLIAMPGFDEIEIVFDATSASAHKANAAALAPYGKRLIDLTPAALGPYVVPAVNLDEHLDAENLNMVTCGGQATIPIVAAVSRIAPMPYAEIVASIASKSAGPGTRANIDEFTETTSQAIVSVGGARARQGDHHPEPRRAAADHARHRLLPGRGPGRGAARRDPGVGREDGRRRRRLRPRLPAQAAGADHRRSPTTSRCTPCSPRGRRPGPPTGCRSSSRSRGPRTTSRRTPGTSTS